jgi:hypothetical protein
MAKKERPQKLVKGKDIVRLESIVQFGDNGHIKAETENGETIMIPLETLFPIFDNYVFFAEKKRKYFSLVSGSPIDLSEAENTEYE